MAAELFRDFPVEVLTEDGSIGRQELVSAPLAQRLDPTAKGEAIPEIFACGPAAMLKAVVSLCAAADAAVQISVASHMACGVGACQGCAIEAAGGYVKVCTDGPVFRAGELKW